MTTHRPQQPPDTSPSHARVLFDATNLAVGGGVQVAASLVDELIRLQDDAQVCHDNPWLAELTFHLSSHVAANCSAAISRHPAMTVFDRSWRAPERYSPFRKRTHDVHLTVFGPRYGFRRGRITITGLADVTSVYSWPAGVPKGTWHTRLKRTLRGAIARKLFSGEDYLISESTALLSAFQTRTDYASQQSFVVPNVVNRTVIESEISTWGADRVFAGRAQDIAMTLIGYVARLYPHKNHEFLAAVHKELLRMGRAVKFVVTLTDTEWNKCSSGLRNACINVGSIPVDQIGHLSAQCQAMIFPSLLESQSAAPLEALATNGLLFASDRPFVWESAGDAALYFDPLDPRDCARLIHQTLTDEELIATMRTRASDRTASLPNARSRAAAYIRIISDALRASAAESHPNLKGSTHA